MKFVRPKISYDKESQVLSIEVGRKKSIDSDIQGNVVIDYGKDGEIVRINLYNFSFDAFRNHLKELKRFGQNFGEAVAVK